MILRARAIATMDGPPIHDGAIATKGGRIVDVGPWREVRTRQTGAVKDLGEQALLPGLINAHCHLEYTCFRGAIPRRDSFAAWVQQIVAAKAKLTPAEVGDSFLTGLREAQRFGTTTIADVQSFPHDAAVSPLRILSFQELIDVGSREIDVPQSDYLSPHAIYTASPALYQSCNERAKLVTTHVAESSDELSMFRERRGPLFDFLRQLGRPMDDCDGRTPVGHFLEQCLPNANYIVAHLNEIGESDWPLLERAPRFAIAHCPRSHRFFDHAPFQFAKLSALGFNICLGTDSLASNDDLSLFAEMRAFAEAFPQVAPEDVLAMVTTKAAEALGLSQETGRIRSGTLADLIAVPFTGSTQNLFGEALGFEGAVRWMMVEGQEVGDSLVGSRP